MTWKRSLNSLVRVATVIFLKRKLDQTGSVEKKGRGINAAVINTYLVKLKVRGKNCSGGRWSQE